MRAFRIEDSKGRESGPLQIGVTSRDAFGEDFCRIGSSPPMHRLHQMRQVYRHCSWESSVTQPTRRAPIVSTRGVHVTMVVATAGNLARELDLNVEYCQTSAFGHDAGHPGKGHMAEDYYAHLFAGFSHKRWGVILFQQILKLDLLYETLMGIACNVKDGALGARAVTPEHTLTALADKIAYVFTDAMEFLEQLHPRQSPYITLSRQKRVELSKELWALLAPFIREGEGRSIGTPGSSIHWRWIHRAEDALVAESLEAGKIQFQESPLAKAFWTLKKWLADNVYDHTDTPEDWQEINRVLSWLCESPRYRGYDPFVLFALMTDPEVRTAAHGLKYGIPEQDWDCGPHDVLCEYGPSLPKQGEIRLDEPYRATFSGVDLVV